jgi:probable rRNA maturation factor
MEGRAIPLSLFLLPGAESRRSPKRSNVILERRRTKELSRLALARFAGRAQRAARLTGEVNILLTGDAEIQQLNQQFRKLAKPTDVLSFPSADGLGGGDIAISIETARAQALELGHPLLTEVKVLILHGILHLAGHDHERDHGRMRRLESKLRAQLHLPAGLIERTTRRPR